MFEYGVLEDVPVMEPPRVSTGTSDVLRSAPDSLFQTYHPAPAPAPRILPGDRQVAAQSWGDWIGSWFRGSDKPAGERPGPGWWERLTSSVGSFLTAPFRWAKTAGLWAGGAVLVLGVLVILILLVGTRFLKAAEG